MALKLLVLSADGGQAPALRQVRVLDPACVCMNLHGACQHVPRKCMQALLVIRGYPHARECVASRPRLKHDRINYTTRWPCCLRRARPRMCPAQSSLCGQLPPPPHTHSHTRLTNTHTRPHLENVETASRIAPSPARQRQGKRYTLSAQVLEAGARGISLATARTLTQQQCVQRPPHRAL